MNELLRPNILGDEKLAVARNRSAIYSETLRDMRLARNETQSRFWGRFGVTQTRGSRFELGQAIPQTVNILIRLYLDGVISDSDLWRARRRQRIYNNRLSNSPRENFETMGGR